MNTFLLSVKKVLKGSADAFKTFPIVIGSALIFTIITLVRIHLDWEQQEQFNFLFNCLHLSFAFSALFGLTAITYVKTKLKIKNGFLYANLAGVLALAIAFICLYYFGGESELTKASRYNTVTVIAATRISMAMLISYLGFICLCAGKKERADFADSFFISHKAFFIALIYGLFIMSGVSGVAAAFNALIYHGMSMKVYMYIGALTGFFAFTIFVGYFPDFDKEEEDEHWEIAKKQAKFIEILFGIIFVPIMLALTVVLMIWAGKTVVTGQWTTFFHLSGIATAYIIGGTWLYIMLTHHTKGMAVFYKKIYPFTSIFILAFDFWVLATQIGKSGIKTEEYYFSLLWIVGLFAAIMLIIKKSESYKYIFYLFMILAFVSVLPGIGYHSLPVKNQIDRLEKILVENEMLKDGVITPTSKELDKEIKIDITDSVFYLTNARDAKLPKWFEVEYSDMSSFEKTFGFEQTWPDREDVYEPGQGDFMGVNLYGEANVYDIKDYTWAINMQEPYDQEKPITINGKNGEYKIKWEIKTFDGNPNLEVIIDNELAIKTNMNDYIERIVKEYPPESNVSKVGKAEDMSYKITTEKFEILLIFSNININLSTRDDKFSYWFELDSMYLKEL